MKRFCLSIRNKTTNCTATVNELIVRRYLSGSDAFVLIENDSTTVSLQALARAVANIFSLQPGDPSSAYNLVYTDGSSDILITVSDDAALSIQAQLAGSNGLLLQEDEVTGSSMTYADAIDIFVLSESAMSANNLVNIGAENTIESGTEGTITLTEYGASDDTFLLESKATATRIMNQGVEDIVFTLSESEAKTSRVRLRYLSDMDDLNLSDLDSMTVFDLDYITID